MTASFRAGEAHRGAKLNAAVVAEARSLKALGFRLAEIRDTLAVTRGVHVALSTLSQACRGVTWGRVPEPPPTPARAATSASANVDPAIALYRREKARHERRWRPRWREINARLDAMEARAPDFRHFVVGGDRTIPDEYLPPRGLEDWCP